VGKNVAVFVDVANIFYAAKAAGVDIDYVTLLKSATAGRDFVRAYAYTGLDPDNENQRNFHSFLARNSYKVVSKDIRKYGDGKVKANLDIELVVDMMKTARNLDVAIVVSGDGDFAPAIRAVQEMGVRVEVISFRGNTSSDLIEVADLFTDITQLARVEKGSSRSGRRVAGDEEDLSMTEVPDKQTEGTGTQRGRGRGRGRGRTGEAEPVAARGRSSAAREPIAAAAREPIAAAASAAGLTVLPGEKLSRVASVPAPAPEEEPLEAVEVVAGEESGAEGEEARRRRRRRGGRGRGRGRGQPEGGVVPEAAEVDGDAEVDEEAETPEVAAAPRPPRATPFGSFWDSQLGVPASKVSATPSVPEDEDFDEPEIPEYLIAEQRRGQGGRGGAASRGQAGRGGPRGGRAAYTAAIDRERYGRGGGGGGINRYPDVSSRERGGSAGRGRPSEGGFNRQDRPERQDRPDRSGGPRPGAPRSSEPWSEVPEELEAMLRAQLAQSPKGAGPRPSRGPARSDATDAASAAPAEATVADEAVAMTEAAPKRRTTRRKAADADAGPTTAGGPGAPEATKAAAEAAAPKRRATTRRKAAETGVDAATEATASPAAPASDGEAAAPKPRTTSRSRAKATTANGAGTPTATDDAAAEPAAPKRRTARKKAEPA
jgi:uncharacterized LabA/DUF88 family protein